jgi:ubiquinone biosynthesis protein COQ4
MARSPILPRFDLPRAARALSTLLENPDDLPQVFTLIESLSGTAPHRLLLGFRLRKAGAKLLRERPDIAPLLSDREGLRKLPAGSLGRAYLAFVEAEGISPAGIKEASLEGMSEKPRIASFEYLHIRMRDTHDVWHAATGYKGDVLGELALLAFTLGQHWNTGVAFIVFAGLLKGLGRGEWRVILDGHLRGRAAEWLPAQDWESLLPLPLEEVRARLGLRAPAEYTPIRTADLRADGTLAAA